jgi:hypothetical protein
MLPLPGSKASGRVASQLRRDSVGAALPLAPAWRLHRWDFDTLHSECCFSSDERKAACHAPRAQ